MDKLSDCRDNLAIFRAGSGEKLLVATSGFAKGQVLSRFGAGEYLACPDRLSVQIGRTLHIILDPDYLQYINHSCDPNVFFDVEQREIVCLKDISAGGEVTFFYPSTEWSMRQPFDCHCQSSTCLKRIAGAAHMDEEVLRGYRLSRHVLSALEQRRSGHAAPPATMARA